MAKINILFDEKNYSIDEANLAPATDALKAHFETLKGGEEGGSLDYGKTVTFKEYFSGEDLIAFTQSLGFSRPLDLFVEMAVDADTNVAQVFGMTSSPNGLYLQLRYQLLQPKEDGMGSTVIEDLMYEVNNDGSLYGWANVLTLEPLNEPPTITIFSAPPELRYEISQFEPLFDLSSIEGNEGNLDITLDGAVYKVDSTKLEPATNSLIAHLETLKGGEGGGNGLVEGETYTLKNNLNDIDPNDFMKAPLDIAEGAYTIFRYDPSVSAGLGFVTAELLAAFGANVASDGWMVTTPDIENIYYYPLKVVDDANGEMIDNNIGWMTIPGSNVVSEISITIPSPFNADYAGYSLDELAVFFDIPSAGGSLEYGKEYTFKEVITAADFQAFFDNAVAEPDNSTLESTERRVFTGSIDGEDIGLIAEPVGETGFSLLYTRINPSTGNFAMYVYAHKCTEISISMVNATGLTEDGWYAYDVMTKSATKTTAPTTLIPADATIPSGLATTAVFFDIPSAGGSNEVTETVTADSEFSHKSIENCYRIDLPIADIDPTEWATSNKGYIDNHYKVEITFNDGTAAKSFYLDGEGLGSENKIFLMMSEGILCISNGTDIYAYVVVGNFEEVVGAEAYEFLKDAFPPNTILVPQSAFTNLYVETFSITYTTGGGAGNEGDTKIVINGAEYWVDSAKLAEAKRALAEHLKALEDASN